MHRASKYFRIYFKEELLKPHQLFAAIKNQGKMLAKMFDKLPSIFPEFVTAFRETHETYQQRNKKQR